ncbi:glycosyltransferase [Aquirufa rosea]|uniref:Glycosyltransferase n=1 Tax=Aquirufa rosea TaxID=2509241 RepID=A0A4Q1C118_9BACT|nr:glycosyltransferase [Aquirufa rosea]RXK50720.1 glycosyltransferase [Aquirufa rosea]
MKLVIARSNYFSYSETFIDEQIKQMQPFAVLYEGWQPSRLYQGGSIYPFPFNQLLVRGSLRRLLPSFYQKIYTHFLRKYLREYQINALLANYGPLGTHIAEACQAENIPFGIVFLGFDANETKTLENYGKRYAEVLPKAKAIIAVASAMKSTLEKICGPLPNLHIIPCGVDLQQFYPAKEKKKGGPFQLISVARFAAKKGSLLSIQSFEILLKEFPNAQFNMVGDGPLWQEAKDYVQAKGLEKHIHFLGAKSPTEYLPLLQEADAFIQHSIVTPSGDSEGTPVAILEASATGLAIVSTRHAGIPEAVIEEETGILVNEHDVASMGQALIRLAANPALCQQMGMAARKHMAEHYEVGRLSQKIKQLLS